MDLDEAQITIRIDNFLRQFQSCSSTDADFFYRLSELVELIRKQHGIFINELQMAESLTRLSFESINADDDFVYPMKRVL